MYEQFILGIIQGIAEWLPISSEGLIVLVKTNLFDSQENIETIIHQALLLHFGTFFAALIYFRRDVVMLVKTIFKFNAQPKDMQKLLSFLLISTIISGMVGPILIKVLSNFSAQFESQGKIITLFIGFLLLGTAYLELKSKKGGYRKIGHIRTIDSVLLGVVQGFASLPGLSRSGLTVSALLLRKFDKTDALKLSFLMSLPIVLAGNIILNWKLINYQTESLVGLLTSFVFGLATIHLLLKIAEKINFGYFVLLFGILTILSAAI